MRTFTDDFALEAVKRSTTPLWIFKCEFSGGTQYLSDSAFSVPVWDGGITTKPWVSKWSTLNERIGLEISSTSLTQFDITMINDNDVSPNLDSILWNESNPVEADDVTLYLWFEGLNPATDPPYGMWSGSITDFKKLNEIEYQVYFSDFSSKSNANIGYKFDPDDYPFVDENYIGEMANIIYGNPTDVLSVGMNIEEYTNLTLSIDSSQTSFNVDNSSIFSIGYTLYCEFEQMSITNISGSTLTVTRGVASTTASAHTRGTIIRYASRNHVFLVAYHAARFLGSVYLKFGATTTELVTGVFRLTGQSGDSLPGYTGLAVVTVTQKTLNDAIFQASPTRHVDVTEVDITVDCEGFRDSATGTITGTAYKLIRRPDYVAEHFTDYYGSSSWGFYSDAGTYLEDNNYQFNAVINEYVSYRENMKNFALQSRCRFRFNNNQARFTLREVDPEPVSTIDESSILMNNDYKSSLGIERSRESDIINTFNVYYNRNHHTGSFSNFYKIFNLTSVNSFGQKERVQAFRRFNLVKISNMLIDVISFYLARYKDKVKVVSFTTTLDQAHIEFGDIIDISHGDSPDVDGTYEVIQANITPGSINRIDKVDFKCVSIVGSG